ncbi:MAG TPA: hypothetical protein VJN96_24245 [Vicinamibacterales bacterium]|nr:hypothetical protein [Vicinamibacterales bacterium]
MTRNLIVAVVIACVALGVRPGAQARPDFSGKWTLAEASALATFGRSFTATQSGTTLTIESTSLAEPVRQGTAAAAADSTQSLRWTFSGTTSTPPRWTYAMTGEEKRETYTRPASIDNLRPSAMWSYRTTSSERAAWLGNVLVIVSHYFNNVHWPDRVPSDFQAEQTVRLSLALNASGSLVVERVSIADPLPWNLDINLDIPSVQRTIYTKASTDGAR